MMDTEGRDEEVLLVIDTEGRVEEVLHVMDNGYRETS